jgi:hypothetical protein
MPSWQSMQPREKLLALALAGVVGVFMVRPLFMRTFVDPLRERRDRLQVAANDVVDREAKELALMRAQANLKRWTGQSLPPEPRDAQRVYREWLTDLTLLAGWGDVKFDQGSRTPRGDAAVAVPITIEGTATIDQLATFLRHFESADILHRITRLDVDSPSSEGKPRLSIVLTAEGLAVKAAPARQRLFPRTILERELPAAGREALVAIAEDFPAAPGTRIRIGTELLKITEAAEGEWTLERGVDGTTAQTHAIDTVVELAPLRTAPQGRTSPHESFASLLTGRLFTKPGPVIRYNPRLAAAQPPTAYQGRPWTMQLKVESWDPADGEPVYQLAAEPPAGLTLDAKTGRMEWTPAEDLSPSDYEVRLQVGAGANRDRRLSSTLKVPVRPPNNPPQFAEPVKITVFPGQKTSVLLTAEDPDAPRDRLTYSAADLPTGAVVDARTGRFEWTPSLETEPGSHTAKITVRDSGSPPLSDELELTLVVEDDAALYTYLVACVQEADEQEAWLFNRATNKKSVLSIGDELEAAEIQGTLTGIGQDHIVVRREEGTFKLKLGQNLREMEAVSDRAAGGGGGADRLLRPFAN